MNKDKMVELSEEQLEQIVGGANIEEIYKKIDTIYGWVPENVRTHLKQLYEKKGTKAIYAYGEKVLVRYPGSMEMLNLFPKE